MLVKCVYVQVCVLGVCGGPSRYCGKAGLKPCPCLMTECMYVTTVPLVASDKMLMKSVKQMWTVVRNSLQFTEMFSLGCLCLSAGIKSHHLVYSP